MPVARGGVHQADGQRHDLAGEPPGVDRRDRTLVACEGRRHPAPRVRSTPRARGSRPRGRSSGRHPGSCRPASGSARSCGRPSARDSSSRSPPATTAVAAPHMMRSAPYAMACRPEEQKRLTVTADAVTGTPARRLAMRATFMPCSASGIAQPTITSSISAGSSPGAPSRAARMVAAAMSSGRVVRSVPAGALPTAVRTAETMTASFMTISTTDGCNR